MEATLQIEDFISVNHNKSTESSLRREPYPLIEPYSSGNLKVSEIHTLYWEQNGNPDGYPIVFLHGGPGGGTQAKDRRYFDPTYYRIVLFDQRGAGKSTPHACLEENTTWDLVEDVEKIRQHLGIEEWIVFGGSWGSTLSLAYAQSHPERVTGLILRGIFLIRKKEIDWFYEGGAATIYPDAWEDYRDFIPEEERGNFVAAYHKRLNSSDPSLQVLVISFPKENTLKSNEKDIMYKFLFRKEKKHHVVQQKKKKL